ncbi:sulfotransferase domain-containing protein [Halorhodospira neutriphila]|uniref:Sulfotransferase domain-containing protein n=1 Tax=Halorhodospira neutriphila TaxID=168379 RepID=A0ABS1E2L1_9GAMM|nr:hypothetical protein [Halorhodospira neutriphila]
MESSLTPNFFIVGAPKCGTTSLASWLAENPYVYFSWLKEPHYFSSDLHRSGVKRRSQYLRLFRDASEEHYAIGEASVWYLYSRVAIPRIEQELPGSLYVICIRNPVDMAYSLHGQFLFHGNENIHDFQEAWHAQSERASGRRIPALCYEDPSELIYGQSCALGNQLKRLLDRVPEERVLIVFLEDMKNDPRGQYKRVLNFLGAPDDGRDNFPARNTGSGARWHPLAKVIGSLLELRRRFVPYLGTGIIRSLGALNRVSGKRRDLTTTMRAEIEDYFEEEIQTIERITHRNLSHWRHSTTKNTAQKVSLLQA